MSDGILKTIALVCIGTAVGIFALQTPWYISIPANAILGGVAGYFGYKWIGESHE